MPNFSYINQKGQPKEVPIYMQDCFDLLDSFNFLEDLSGYVPPEQVEDQTKPTIVDAVNTFTMPRTPAQSELDQYKNGYIMQQKVDFLSGILPKFRPDMSKYQPITHAMQEVYIPGCWGTEFAPGKPTPVQLEADKAKYVLAQKRAYVSQSLEVRNRLTAERLDQPKLAARGSAVTASA